MLDREGAKASLRRWLGGEPRGVVFTDVDGTLLDFRSYSASAELVELVKRLKELRVPVGVVTSKTEPEAELLVSSVGVAPFGALEGGAVLWDGWSGASAVLGPSRGELVDALERARAMGARVRGLHEMEAVELAALVGLPKDAAARALRRIGSEPFVAESPSDARLVAEVVVGMGMKVERGGRLYHLLGREIDKGFAVRSLVEWLGLEGVPRAGVGDAWNDLPMLCEVEHGFLLGDAVADRELPCGGIHRVGMRGPAGFVEAVTVFLDRVALDGDGG